MARGGGLGVGGKLYFRVRVCVVFGISVARKSSDFFGKAPKRRQFCKFSSATFARNPTTEVTETVPGLELVVRHPIVRQKVKNHSTLFDRVDNIHDASK